MTNNGMATFNKISKWLRLMLFIPPTLPTYNPCQNISIRLHILTPFTISDIKLDSRH